jgi:hypothetical protein
MSYNYSAVTCSRSPNIVVVVFAHEPPLHQRDFYWSGDDGPLVVMDPISAEKVLNPLPATVETTQLLSILSEYPFLVVHHQKSTIVTVHGLHKQFTTLAQLFRRVPSGCVSENVHVNREFAGWRQFALRCAALDRW